MICINCDRSIKENLKVCPYCGYVLENTSIGVTEHHNFAHETALATNLKMSDTEIPDYGFDYKKLSDPTPLFKSVLFLLANLLMLFIYMLIFYLFTNNIIYAIIVSFFFESLGIILQTLFYKSNDKWYRGVIPIVNILNLYKRFLRDYKAAYSAIYACFFFSTLWVVALFLVFALIAAGFMDQLIKVWFVFLQLEAALLIGVFTVYTLKSFYYVGYRFGTNPFLSMLFFITFIPGIAFNKKYYYHQDQIV